MKSIWSKILAAIFVLFIAIQFYPYGRDHENPEVINMIEWDNPQTKEAFYNACADCHSNETTWPWYSNVAPISWLVQSDVEEGRKHFNISDAKKMRHADDAHKEVAAGEMPLAIYTPLHPEAKMDAEQKEKFIAGLKATFSKEQAREEENEEGNK